MWLKPRDGFLYRDTRTQQLVPADGFEADPNDFDIDRARTCGDLVEAEAPAAEPEPAPVADPVSSAKPAKGSAQPQE